MKRFNRYTLFLLIILYTTGGQAAGRSIVPNDSCETEIPTNEPRKKKKNVIYRFFQQFDNYDTSYITPNYYNYSVMLQNTTSMELLRFSGTNPDDHKQSLHFNSSPSFKVGPYFGWRWIFFGYSFDVANFASSRKKSEFNLSLYSSMLGCDLIYQRNRGDYKIQRTRGFKGIEPDRFRNLDFDGLKTQTTGANVYYIFNHKHFSYPAAFSQSTVQRKSCGTWKLGATFTRQKIEFDYRKLPSVLLGSDNAGLNSTLKFNKIIYNDYSFSVGYAYNWVFAPNCLFCISLAPAIGFKHTESENKTYVEDVFDIRNINVDVITRVGLVWNNTKWFGGLSLVAHTYDYRKNRLSLNNTFGSLKAYFGMNFMQKSQYKRQK